MLSKQTKSKKKNAKEKLFLSFLHLTYLSFVCCTYCPCLEYYFVEQQVFIRKRNFLLLIMFIHSNQKWIFINMSLNYSYKHRKFWEAEQKKMFFPLFCCFFFLWLTKYNILKLDLCENLFFKYIGKVPCFLRQYLNTFWVAIKLQCAHKQLFCMGKNTFFWHNFEIFVWLDPGKHRLFAGKKCLRQFYFGFLFENRKFRENVNLKGKFREICDKNLKKISIRIDATTFMDSKDSQMNARGR